MARMVCNLHWHRQNSHISFGSICGTNFIQSSEKRGICFARRCGYCVDSHIILKRDMPYGISLYGIAEKVVYMFFICLVLSLVENWRVIKWIRLFLVWFGKYSLELYVLHLLIFCFISSKMLFGNIAPIVKVVIMVTGALILCVPFQKLIKNIVGKIKFNNQ